MRNDRSGPPARHGAAQILIAVLGVTALSFVIAAELDLAERLSGWTGTHEWIELDEATIVLAVLVVGLSLFSLLRWSEPGGTSRAIGPRVEVPPAGRAGAGDHLRAGRDRRRRPGRAEFVSPQIEENPRLHRRVEWQSPGHLDERIHPDDHARVMRDWDAALAAGRFRAEYRMYAKDGRITGTRRFPMRRRTDLGPGRQMPETSTKGRGAAALAMRRPSTETSSNGSRPSRIRRIRDTGRFTYVSPRSGPSSASRPRNSSAGLGEAVCIRTTSRVDEDDARSDETGEDFDIEYRIIAKDGREVWVHEHTELIDADGRPPFWLGVIDDITDRRRAEDRVREAEQRYRKLVEQLPAVVYIDAVDELDGPVHEPRYEELLGYTWEQALAARPVGAHPPSRRPRLSFRVGSHEPDRRAVHLRIPADRQGRPNRLGGDEAHLVEDESGGPKSGRAYCSDITERKHREENLRRREAILPAVGYAAQRFLKDPAWENSVDSVFAHLGEAADVSSPPIRLRRRRPMDASPPRDA